MRNFAKVILIGILIGIGLFTIDLVFGALRGREIVFNKLLLTNAAYHQLYAITLTLVNSYFFDYLNERVSWKKYRKSRFWIGALGGITLTMLVIFQLRMVTELGFKGKEWEVFIKEEQSNVSFYALCLLITIIISIFFHAVYFYKELQKNKITEQKIIAGSASAQFDALKNQLDPHFLFNSLNVLTSLIDENPGAAQKFTTSLSKVYRYVLEQKNKELISVDEELKFARTYVSLLKMRFEDSILFEVPESVSNPEAKVVPLSLQLLLENAVKHNMVTPSKPLHIKIFEKGNALVIENNIQPKQVVKKSSGVGLRNIQQRYSLLTNRQVDIEKSGKSFTVSIPMLTRQVSTAAVSQKSYIKDKRYQRARERVDALKSFYGNVISYLIVIPLLAIFNYRTSDFPWVIFPALGWGFGVIAHGMEAYGYNPLLGKRWEERKIRELMEKEEKKY
ncbi:histidine kinase [Leptobacterium flavescens]|uniref:Histidine kinase n=1 Tax=Leptobacterium flavescens TaxID=472055 RepID=A0A6P0UM89_9FLAO|nr:2TM domain-containing protein [Leptobacterium flavescens]NER14137.1 histidine kinase [Leptobacterium flavescens]